MKFEKSIKLKSDNQATLALQRIHDGTKHVEIDCHFIARKIGNSRCNWSILSLKSNLQTS